MQKKVIKIYPQKPSTIKLISTLAIAGLISGIAIIAIYEITLPTITAYKAKVLREAVFNVLPKVVHIQKLHYLDNKLQPVDSESNNEIIYAGFDAEKKLIGYAIEASGPGFQDTIQILYGYIPAKRLIVGMEVLESRETPGLGDKIYKDTDFQMNFKALTIEPAVVMVKKGMKSATNEVDAITGATISSKAIVKIINQSKEKWIKRIEP
ncbi:RnfABCDGE type electron transport complex subunit G [Thiotrichales bacterium HSG1]|nr:RnfABCDGE type electron transport complex subunit G [Thiotrichales bacterium HSG1]